MAVARGTDSELQSGLGLGLGFLRKPTGDANTTDEKRTC